MRKSQVRPIPAVGLASTGRLRPPVVTADFVWPAFGALFVVERDARRLTATGPSPGCGTCRVESDGWPGASDAA